jgi:hypothetical protein
MHMERQEFICLINGGLLSFSSSDLLTTLSMRSIPPYGVDTIRRVSNNVSELKKMAARDFEDILQVG